MNEDILKNALEQALDESYNELIDQDIPDYDFSPEFKAKMDGLILSQQTQPEKKRSKMLWFSAMAAAAALLCVTVGIANTARPSRKPDTQSGIISETTETTLSAVSAEGTTGTAAVTETRSTTAETQTTKAVSEKKTATAAETTAVTAKQTKTSAASRTTAQTTKAYSAPSDTTSASSAAVSVTTVSETAIVTDITTTTAGSIFDDPNERSFSMKKLSAFLAALITAQSAAPSIINGEDQPNRPQASPLMKQDTPAFISTVELYEQYRANESIFDFNEDGTFDIRDLYIYYHVTHGHTDDSLIPDLDIDRSGEPDTITDFKELTYYFASYNTIAEGDFDVSRYSDAADGILSELYLSHNSKDEDDTDFLIQLSGYANDLYRLYDLFKDLTETRAIDLDFDRNGTFDLGDVFDLSYFVGINPLASHAEEYEHISTGCYLSEEEYDRLTEFVKSYDVYGQYPLGSSIRYYALQYLFETDGFRDEYAAFEYQMSVRPFGANGIGMEIANYSENVNNISGDRRYAVDSSEETISSEYNSFISKVDKGELTVPDLNGDGKLDMGDIRLSELFLNEYRYKNDIPFPLEYRQNFLDNMDLNGNGFAGDINDLAIYQSYISDLNGYTYENFNYELQKYYYEHPDFDPEHAGYYKTIHTYNINEESPYSMYQKYLEQLAKGENIEPDVNKDGKIDIADYALANIMINAKAGGTDIRMSIVPDDVRDFFLNDFDLDKDGFPATYTDYDIMTFYVADKLGMEVNADSPDDIDSILYDKAEQYITQFDEELPDEERTQYYRLAPELVKYIPLDKMDALLYLDVDEEDYLDKNKYKLFTEMSEEQKSQLDVNMNGTIENEDWALAQMLMDNYERDNVIYRGKELLTDEIKAHFYENFDFNNNGVNGDKADRFLSDYYYSKIFGSEYAVEEYWDEYIRKENEKRIAELNKPIEVKLREFEEKYEKYRQNVENGTMPAPDINEDGVIDHIDYAAAEAATHSRITFRYRYGLITETHIISDEQYERYFNTYDADGNGTYGDQEDLKLIQRYITDRAGKGEFEFKAEVEEYISQYDDVISEFQHTVFYGLDKDLTDGMSALEKYSLFNSEHDSEYYKEMAKTLTDEQIKMLDANNNGTLEPEDYITAYYLNGCYTKGYEKNCSYPEDSSLVNDDIRKSFYTSYDPNSNGICGDCGDIMLANAYFSELFGTDNLYYGYRYKELGDVAVPLSKALNNSTEKRSGDANVDSVVSLADSVAILQAYINPSKYTLTDEGRYNADISNTGDGITPMDAREIQSMLLGIY
ncbi:MAG: hypothetical protein IJ779_06595 [Ruminococcus sp.]|nr:hypothetical protein [Ruminococcus sp.]